MTQEFPGGTASVAEAVFWSALMRARAGMPCPFKTQHALILEGSRVIPDFAWPDVQVLVEIDGREYHTDVRPFTRDRQKDRLYRRAGWTYVRFSASEVLGAGGAEMCVIELFTTLGWPYPKSLEHAPDEDLMRPASAPESARVRTEVVEVQRESTVNVRRRRWSS